MLGFVYLHCQVVDGDVTGMEARHGFRLRFRGHVEPSATGQSGIENGAAGETVTFLSSFCF